jgi:ferrochelatase
MSGPGRIAVLLMAYGTPQTREAILPYYTDIRRGRPPTDEQLADLTRRYEAIGGLSPLMAVTAAQGVALQNRLDELSPSTYDVVLAFKHADPQIEATVQSLAAQGHDQIVATVLAPHFSEYSVGQYIARVEAAAAPFKIKVQPIRSWATDPVFIKFLADDLALRLSNMPTKTRVLFTAHSLPERILTTADPYPSELRSTAEAVAAVLGLTEGDDWSVAWQSAGRTPEPWIGPDILEVIDRFGDHEDVDGVVVSACGFVADHLEVLYDLDIEARARAESNGLGFDRTASVNDDRNVIAALGDRVHAAAQ